MSLDAARLGSVICTGSRCVMVTRGSLLEHRTHPEFASSADQGDPARRAPPCRQAAGAQRFMAG